VPSILADAGPLIALFLEREPRHKEVKRFLKVNKSRLLSTWPVITEVCHFLNNAGKSAFLTWVARGGLIIEPISVTDLDDLIALLAKYTDREMDFADASLIWLADKSGIADILTLDRKDFAVFRLSSGKSFRQVF
jgi:uncharacterized protein